VPNLILTPHRGAATTAARAATARTAATQLLAVLQGRPVPAGACVNPQVLGDPDV
jgi:D-3-phosphoglycerate dehydrogenase